MRPPSSRSPTRSRSTRPSARPCRTPGRRGRDVRMRLGKLAGGARRLREVPRHLRRDADWQGLCRSAGEDPMTRMLPTDKRSAARSRKAREADLPETNVTIDPVSETLGGYLRRQRERRGMSVAELSRVTRIPTASLEAIEADRFDELPGEVFVRGFLEGVRAGRAACSRPRSSPATRRAAASPTSRRCRCRRRCRRRARGRAGAGSAWPSRSCCCSSCCRSRCRSCSSRAGTTCPPSCRRRETRPRLSQVG